MPEELINLADLPEELRQQVVAARSKKVEQKGLSLIEPRLYQAHFQTKEQREYGEKLDELIDQWNLALPILKAKKEQK